MDEYTYINIMNRLFLEAENVLGNEMVDLGTVGNIIKEECGLEDEG